MPPTRRLSMAQIRLGLLGAGFLHDFYMQALREIPAVEVVAVATQTEPSAKRFASKWGLPRAEWGNDALEKLCSSPDLDAISVALPNDLHLPAVKLAAENGKHVICEKPLGRNLAEAKAILHDAEKAGILHGYAENQAFFPLHLHAFETIK